MKKKLLGCAVLVMAAMSAGTAFGEDIRIAAYNIEADVGTSSEVPPSSMETVLEAIGNETTYAPAQALDVIGLEETSGSTTVAPMVTSLNAHYGAGVYATTSTQASNPGGTGNGPSSIIYNTTTLNLVLQGGLQFYTVPGTPGGSSSSGTDIPRAVLRYEFQPKAGGNPFYIYVSHMKSTAGDTGSAAANDASDRATEATAIRNDEALLPAGASVMYMGDYNMGGTSEAGYQTMTALTSPAGSGNVSQGKAFDPIQLANPSETTWSNSNNDAAYDKMITESIQDSSGFEYRDDLMMMTSNMYNGQTGGLSLVANSEHVFGNPGNLQSGSTFLSGANGNSTLAQALENTSDHLPVVADFNLVLTPEPGSLVLLGMGIVGVMRRRRR